MTVKVDKAGRVVLPKSVRDRLGLHEGSDLEMEETPEGVVLKPAGQLVRKGSFLVHTGKLPRSYNPLRAIDQDREDRDRKIWGQ